MGGMPLAQVPGLSGRGCLSLALDSGYLRPLSGKSRICHIPGRPRLPSYWAWKSPQGQAGLRAGKTGLPTHPPLHHPGVRGEGVSRNWWFPTFHTG